MKLGDLVKYRDTDDSERWIPASPEYFEVVAAMESTVGVVVSEKILESTGVERFLVHWLDIGRSTYENARYLEVVS